MRRRGRRHRDRGFASTCCACRRPEPGTGSDTLRGKHYRFSLLPPFFNPGRIDHPAPPIYLAAVNPYMSKLAGELCAGIRLHAIDTFRYTQEIVLPAIAAGAAKAGRRLADVDLVGAPFLAIGADEGEVRKAMQALKQHVSFYASTRTYHTVLAHHGWEDVGLELHRLSREGKWQEMPALITDDMLREWAVIATYDQLAAELRRRCDSASRRCPRLPHRFQRDEDRVRELVRTLHG
jgi:probable F420-dependent oxidoreductase